MDFKGIGCEGGFSYNELSNCIKAYHFLRKWDNSRFWSRALLHKVVRFFSTKRKVSKFIHLYVVFEMACSGYIRCILTGWSVHCCAAINQCKRLKYRSHYVMFSRFWKARVIRNKKYEGVSKKFPDWVDNEINNNKKHSSRSNTKSYGGKTHYTDSQNNGTTARSGRKLYHLHFSLQAASPETFRNRQTFGTPELIYTWSSVWVMSWKVEQLPWN
jgi:hypothetical protein